MGDGNGGKIPPHRGRFFAVIATVGNKFSHGFRSRRQRAEPPWFAEA
jgi:hypothetical protein